MITAFVAWLRGLGAGDDLLLGVEASCRTAQASEVVEQAGIVYRVPHRFSTLFSAERVVRICSFPCMFSFQQKVYCKK